MASLTLSEKATLSASQSFRDRFIQGLFSKANVYIQQTPLNLAWQKQVNFGKSFTKGAVTYDAVALTRFWLANYNGNAILDGNNQPIDTEILNSAGLDVVYNAMANVITGDDALPIQ
ncbi:MAG TPA: hypothetical protein VL443_24365 [Cyclobacteriaceae bacterium]|jgi:hypothetical protein|nr:hypothetical protein [Cyclobacteriaceae bacterium]